MKSELQESWLVCRVCLKPPKEPMMRIFNKNDDQDLTKMLLECGGIPIKRFDHYPDKICLKCYKYLRVAYKFRLTCQRSHNHLSKIIAPAVDIDAEKKQDTEDWETEVALEIDEVELGAHKYESDDILAIKEELAEIEKDNDDEVDEVVDVYEPMDDELEANEAAFEELDSIQRLVDEHEDVDEDDIDKEIKDDDEYYDEFMADVSTSDEDFNPNQRSPTKKTSKQSRKSGGGSAAKESPMRKSRAGGTTTNRATDAGTEQPKRKRGPKPKDVTSYICDVCGNIYPSQGRLNEHLKLHKGVKPHECEICGHAFAQTQQLARHMNTHTGNRPFKCSYCPAAFADLSTRNKHHRIHTNERPYVCDVCGKSFTYTNTLKFHKMIHTGEKPHVCDICGKGFMQAYKMRNHRMIHLKKGIKLERLEVEQVTHFNEATEGAVLEICAQ